LLMTNPFSIKLCGKSVQGYPIPKAIVEEWEKVK